MTDQEIIAALRRIEPVLRRHGATSLHIFGSRARGDNRDDSDLDVFIEYDPNGRFSLLDLVHLGQIIEDETNLKVDIITREGIKPFLKREIEQSARQVF
jgi:uncharacterized protein